MVESMVALVLADALMQQKAQCDLLEFQATWLDPDSRWRRRRSARWRLRAVVGYEFLIYFSGTPMLRRFGVDTARRRFSSGSRNATFARSINSELGDLNAFVPQQPVDTQINNQSIQKCASIASEE